MTPLAALALVAGTLAVLLILVLGLRLHAFPALLLTALLAALAGGVPMTEIVDVLRQAMGGTLGYIAVVIGLGAMFGEMLYQSGGARRIADTLLASLGEERAPTALGLTGLVVAIPVFFDVAFILLVPLLHTLVRRTGRSIVRFAVPLLAGLAVAHAFIPPTPGPVAVAGLLGADLGWVILFGLAAGTPALVVGGLLYGRWVAPPNGSKGVAPVTPDEGPSPLQSPDQGLAAQPPGFALVTALVALPLGLILLSTVTSVVLDEGDPRRQVAGLVGHPFVALLLALLLAFHLLGTRRGWSREQLERLATRSLEPVGAILLLTGAGGCLGKVLLATGAGEVAAEWLQSSSLPMLLLAFLLALVVRIAQGSATVSMVTAAGLMAPLLAKGLAAPDRAALVVVIAAGATACSHVNDSGFWLVSRYLGLDTRDTLRIWTVTTALVGVTGLLGASLLAMVL